MEITAQDIEIAVARWFGIRSHVIVPNLSWGMLPYECDIAVMPVKGRYLYEVEIKVSKSDLIRDKDKQKWKWGGISKVRKFWYAIPKKLEGSISHIPEFAGIFIISEPEYSRKFCGIEQVRKPKLLQAKPMTDEQRFNLARLGAMRIWALKEVCMNYKKREQEHGNPAGGPV